MPQSPEPERSWSIQKFASNGQGMIVVGCADTPVGHRPLVMIVDDTRRKPRPVTLEPVEAADVALRLLADVVKGAPEEDALRMLAVMLTRRLR
jgi:hypothetical protein